MVTAPSAEPLDPIELHIASRLRERRRELKISQGALGKALRISSQQVHNIEKGNSRISAGRLFHAARHLETPIAIFFPEAESEGPAERFQLLVDGPQIIAALLDLSADQRRILLEVAQAMRTASDEAAAISTTLISITATMVFLLHRWL